MRQQARLLEPRTCLPVVRDLARKVPTATPTPTRRAKHCFLQVAAHDGFELKKADVLPGHLLDGPKSLTSP